MRKYRSSRRRSRAASWARPHGSVGKVKSKGVVNNLNHSLSITFSVSGVRSRAGGVLMAVITLLSEVLHDRCSVPRDTPRLLDKLASVFPLSSG